MLEKVLIAALSALLGFIASQSTNIVKLLRRPKFRISVEGSGIVESYSGGDDDPAFLVVGFTLENCGRTTARDLQVFIDNLSATRERVGELQSSSVELFELPLRKRFLLPGERMTVKVGRLSSNEDWFNPFSTDPSQYDEWGNLHFISADTWQARRLSYDVRVVCSNDYSSLIGRAEAKLDEADEMEPFLNSRAKGMLGGRSA